MGKAPYMAQGQYRKTHARAQLNLTERNNQRRSTVRLVEARFLIRADQQAAAQPGMTGGPLPGKSGNQTLHR